MQTIHFTCLINKVRIPILFHRRIILNYCGQFYAPLPYSQKQSERGAWVLASMDQFLSKLVQSYDKCWNLLVSFPALPYEGLPAGRR